MQVPMYGAPAEWVFPYGEPATRLQPWRATTLSPDLKTDQTQISSPDAIGQDCYISLQILKFLRTRSGFWDDNTFILQMRCWNPPNLISLGQYHPPYPVPFGELKQQCSKNLSSQTPWKRFVTHREDSRRGGWLEARRYISACHLQH